MQWSSKNTIRVISYRDGNRRNRYYFEQVLNEDLNLIANCFFLEEGKNKITER